MYWESYFPRLYASKSVYTRKHINLIKGVSTPLKYVEVGYRDEMPIIFYILAFLSKGKANPRVWRHEIMERKGLIKRVVRYGHGAAAFPMSIMEVLFGSLCLRDETIRGFSKSVGNT